MLKHIVHLQPMDSMTSYIELLNYQQETILIGQDYLVSNLANLAIESLVASSFGIGVFINDQFKPVELVTSRDFFAVLDGRQFVPVEIKRGIPKKGLHLMRWNPKGYHEPVNLLMAYGSSFRLDRSPKATAKLLGLFALDMYLEMADFHKYTCQPKPVMLKTILPQADEEKWREHTIATLSQSGGFSFEEAVLAADSSEFKNQLWKFIRGSLEKALKPIEDFLNGCQHHFVELHYDESYFYITKGIDHRYLPYYKQKFEAESQVVE